MGCGNAREHIESGKRLFAEKKFEESEQEFREAIRINPNSVEARFHLGRVLYFQGELEGSIEIFEKVKYKNPNESLVWYYLGLTYLVGDDLEEAERNFIEAKRVEDPSNKRATCHLYFCLALCKLKKGQIERANEFLLKIVPTKGIEDLSGIINDPDFDLLRNEPEFIKLIEIVKKQWEEKQKK